MNIPPSFRFTGDRERALSLRSEALIFSNFINSQAELGGVSFLHREQKLSDGSTISVTTRKGDYNLRTSAISIFGIPVPVSSDLKDLVVTYWDCTSPENTNITYEGRAASPFRDLFVYGSSITPTKQTYPLFTNRLGSSAYWYSKNYKESVSWDTKHVKIFINGLEVYCPVQAISNISAAAIKNGFLYVTKLVSDVSDDWILHVDCYKLEKSTTMFDYNYIIVTKVNSSIFSIPTPYFWAHSSVRSLDTSFIQIINNIVEKDIYFSKDLTSIAIVGSKYLTIIKLEDHMVSGTEYKVKQPISYQQILIGVDVLEGAVLQSQDVFHGKVPKCGSYGTDDTFYYLYLEQDVVGTKQFFQYLVWVFPYGEESGYQIPGITANGDGWDGISLVASTVTTTFNLKVGTFNLKTLTHNENYKTLDTTTLTGFYDNTANNATKNMTRAQAWFSKTSHLYFEMGVTPPPYPPPLPIPRVFHFNTKSLHYVINAFLPELDTIIYSTYGDTFDKVTTLGGSEWVYSESSTKVITLVNKEGSSILYSKSIPNSTFGVPGTYYLEYGYFLSFMIESSGAYNEAVIQRLLKSGENGKIGLCVADIYNEGSAFIEVKVNKDKPDEHTFTFYPEGSTAYSSKNFVSVTNLKLKT